MAADHQNPSGCVFCAIVAGNQAAAVVLDEAGVMAFLDRSPVFKGHTLVVPHEHVETLPDIDPADLPTLFGAVRRVAEAVAGRFGAQGSFVAVNNTVSQSVPHLHVHVVPRTKGDGLRGFFWPRQKYENEAEMADYASRLRDALG